MRDPRHLPLPGRHPARFDRVLGLVGGAVTLLRRGFVILSGVLDVWFVGADWAGRL